jgi:hypothetical protein
MFSGHWILANVFITQATFSLLLHPHLLALVLPSEAERSPTDVFLHPIALTDHLVSFIFSARALDQ